MKKTVQFASHSLHSDNSEVSTAPTSFTSRLPNAAASSSITVDKALLSQLSISRKEWLELLVLLSKSPEQRTEHDMRFMFCSLIRRLRLFHRVIPHLILPPAPPLPSCSTTIQRHQQQLQHQSQQQTLEQQHAQSSSSSPSPTSINEARTLTQPTITTTLNYGAVMNRIISNTSNNNNNNMMDGSSVSSDNSGAAEALNDDNDTIMNDRPLLYSYSHQENDSGDHCHHLIPSSVICRYAKYVHLPRRAIVRTNQPDSTLHPFCILLKGSVVATARTIVKSGGKSSSSSSNNNSSASSRNDISSSSSNNSSSSSGHNHGAVNRSSSAMTLDDHGIADDDIKHNSMSRSHHSSSSMSISSSSRSSTSLVDGHSHSYTSNNNNNNHNQVMNNNNNSSILFEYNETGDYFGEDCMDHVLYHDENVLCEWRVSSDDAIMLCLDHSIYMEHVAPVYETEMLNRIHFLKHNLIVPLFVVNHNNHTRHVQNNHESSLSSSGNNSIGHNNVRHSNSGISQPMTMLYNLSTMLELVKQMNSVHYGTRKVVLKQDQKSNGCMYFIRRGECIVLKRVPISTINRSTETNNNNNNNNTNQNTRTTTSNNNNNTRSRSNSINNNNNNKLNSITNNTQHNHDSTTANSSTTPTNKCKNSTKSHSMNRYLELARLKQGEYFGELAILQQQRLERQMWQLQDASGGAHPSRINKRNSNSSSPFSSSDAIKTTIGANTTTTTPTTTVVIQSDEHHHHHTELYNNNHSDPSSASTSIQYQLQLLTQESQTIHRQASVFTVNATELLELSKMTLMKYLSPLSVSKMEDYAHGYHQQDQIIAQYLKQRRWAREKAHIVQSILTKHVIIPTTTTITPTMTTTSMTTNNSNMSNTSGIMTSKDTTSATAVTSTTTLRLK